MAIRAAFWFDVEDYISPRSDDALKSLLEIFDRRDAKATWKLVGEKTRSLVGRNRKDIIGLISTQDIGYHTDFHSMHPTISEYCEGLGWEEGQREFERREADGLNDIRNVFGRIPSTFGQPGASWAPHIYPILRKWNIPTYMDETSQIGLNNGLFYYCGILNILNLGPNTQRMEISRRADTPEAALNRFDEAIRRFSETTGGGLLQVFYHPCEYSTDEFWDYENFRDGINTSRAHWRLPLQNTDDEMERRLGAFADYLDGILARGIKPVTASELQSIYTDRAIGKSLDHEQLEEVFNALNCEEIAPAVFKDFSISPAECLLVAINYLSAGSYPVRFVYGPSVRAFSRVNSVSLPTDSLIDACRQAAASTAISGHMPSSFHAGSAQLSPADFARTVSQLCLIKMAGRELPASVPFLKGQLRLEANIQGEGAWNWSIFPQGFDAPNIIEAGRLQAWTLKPAIEGK